MCSAKFHAMNKFLSITVRRGDQNAQGELERPLW
jgi:hypothetical protein